MRATWSSVLKHKPRYDFYSAGKHFSNRIILLNKIFGLLAYFKSKKIFSISYLFQFKNYLPTFMGHKLAFFLLLINSFMEFLNVLNILNTLFYNKMRPTTLLLLFCLAFIINRLLDLDFILRKK